MLGKWALEKLVFPGKVQYIDRFQSQLETINLSAAAAIARSNTNSKKTISDNEVPEEENEKMF
jgi:hypothetical protein